MALFRPKRLPKILTVKDAWHLTPHMIRVTFAGPELAGIPLGCEGAHCKLQLPEPDQSREEFVAQLSSGKAKPKTRTYTVRHVRHDATNGDMEMDIDFVDHGDAGPASAWARAAKPGAFLGFMGPGPIKVTEFEADHWLIAADMSALPVAAATMERLPADAKGIAVFEVTSPEDRQTIQAPEGIEQIWHTHADPHQASQAQVEEIKSRPWPAGRVKTCIAGETGTIRAFKALVEHEKAVPRQDAYISGYWKIGLVEDEHQAMKRRGS